MVLRGDEWHDESTYELTKELAVLMAEDRRRAVLGVKENRIFVAYKNIVVLRLELWEFGYEGESESVNVGAYNMNEERPKYIQMGYTYTRSAKELWKQITKSLGV